MHMRDTMIGRVRVGQPHTEHAVTTIHGIFDIGDSIKVLAKNLDGDRHLTSAGRQAKVTETVRAKSMKEFAQASRAVRKALGRFEAQRAGLGLPKVDRTDAVGELRRQEIRAYVRSLPLADRMKAARDATIADALLDAPPVLSGLEPDFHAKLQDTRVRELHGPALAELDAQERDYREVEAVAVIVRNELFQASGLSREGFEEQMRPLEAEADRI